MKLIIEIDVDSSDFGPEDVEVFKEVADRATSINLEVGHPVDGPDGDRGVFCMTNLSTEYFKVTIKQ